ncbi:MAG TPA: AAA family ATPase [candidate division Zixibacteria bacterium]|nr:AAA family ATPase [candidate division Zixibacteria bacterium]
MKYPFRHISIRVPWHDAEWNGTVCQSPKHNTSCLKLGNIFKNKNEAAEEQFVTNSLKDIQVDDYPPCVRERATFMANFPFDIFPEHPYAKGWSGTHSHFKKTLLHFPAYGAAALPFRWLNKKFVWGNPDKENPGFVEDFPLSEVDQSVEPELDFETKWIQDHRNHRALLECFWNHVRKEESLVFFYAKQIPLVEDTGRRVLIGVGRVLNIGELTEYEYTGSTKGKIRSLLWERMVIHSIRPDFKDGFLLPYHEALEKSDDGRNFDPAEVVAFAPEDRFVEFSYVTEHVGNDAAISALLACRASLLRASELFNYQSRPQEEWIDRQLGRLWKKRGAFPGLGAVLIATSVPMGHFLAQALVEEVGEDGNPWEAWDKVLSAPKKHLPPDLVQYLDDTIIKSWQKLSAERRSFLELLSRIDLTDEQAIANAIPEERQESGIMLNDKDFLKNPYLLYEATRLSSSPISIGAVDRGMFPTAFIRDRHPVPDPSTVKTAVDARRLRALVIRELEGAVLRGDTVCAQSDIINAIRHREEIEDEQRTPVTADLLAVVEEERFSGEIQLVQMADGRRAYQLERLAAVGKLIRSTVNKRIEAERHQVNVDWRAELDKSLEHEQLRKGLQKTEDPVEIEKEERARQEKSAALTEIASSRFSVLIGPAGTGKTTLLSVLCQRPEIHNDGILLLAPTGKARVRMEDVAKRAGAKNFRACTIAKFLLDSNRYDLYSQRYLLTGEPGDKVGRTVIVDECSMLTEEMMGALLEAISGVHRLIFVGDPRQLPPIGAGRPFVDIIARLRPDNIESQFPSVAKGYSELTISRRQGAGEREDLQLAGWFGGNVVGPGEDQVFEILAGRCNSETVQFIPWNTPDELEKLIPAVLAESLGFDNKLEEWQAFAKSLGGVIDNNGSAWFNNKYGKYEGASRYAEAWQILSPVRQKPWGVDTLNRIIHLRYKVQEIDKARNPGKYRSIPKPLGDNQLVYGDKVINNSNWSVPKGRIRPKPNESGYLANGEIGMAVGHRRTKNRDWKPTNLEIEFSTQQGKVFTFYPGDFEEEGKANLELAYALTVHKAQGSEFEVVFLILPRSPLMLTRELLYTALTRQRQKVVIFHQGSATDLQKLSSERYSAIATRLTNLFRPPNPVAVGDKFLEEWLIHRTERGEAVRSKSEVIIADKLYHWKLDYHYEAPLEIDGVVKYPDFTIEDDDIGITYFWEHCGMLQDPAYEKRWKKKLEWYRSHDIKPRQEDVKARRQLIVTEDKPDGGIDSQMIAELIKEVFSD